MTRTLITTRAPHPRKPRPSWQRLLHDIDADASLYEWPKLNRLPSEYVKEFFKWGFFNDLLGVRIRHEIGVENMMWGSDFSHVESDWPNSPELLERHFADVPKEDTYAILAGNAIEFFHLDEYK